jgi:hypothetical protein
MRARSVCTPALTGYKRVRQLWRARLPVPPPAPSNGRTPGRTCPWVPARGRASLTRLSLVMKVPGSNPGVGFSRMVANFFSKLGRVGCAFGYKTVRELHGLPHTPDLVLRPPPLWSSETIHHYPGDDPVEFLRAPSEASRALQ